MERHNLGSEPGQPVQRQLRSLRPHHLEACLGLDQLSLNGLWSASQWATELADPRRPGTGIWLGDELAAMACGWLVLDELHITLVAVAPHRRRLGLGRQVLNALLEAGGRAGARHATLEVADGNHAACALYRAAGFKAAGRRRGYYRNGDDALIQWLRLPEVDGGAGNRAEPQEESQEQSRGRCG